MEMKTEEIKVKENVRKDFGDLTELTESIKRHGIIEPLVVNKEKELIAGERRLRAAKAAGLVEVPVVVRDSDDESAEALIENIQRKDLTPVEEGNAFADYMRRKKCNSVMLAIAIGKTTQYVDRRLLLPKLTVDAAKALDSGKIKIGHATILAQLSAEQQNVGLKAIIEGRYSPKEFATFLAWNSKVDVGASGEEIELLVKEKGQTILTDVGAKLPERSDIVGSKAFAKDLNAYIESEKRRLMKQGISVVSRQHVQTKYPHAQFIDSWDQEYKTALKELPKSKDYAVIMEWNGHRLDKAIVRLVKLKKEEKLAEQMTKKEIVAAERVLNLSREQKLKNRMEEFKKKFKVAKTEELMSPATKLAKAMNLYALMSNAPFRGECRPLSEVLLKEMGFTKSKYDYKPVVSLTKILKLDEKSIISFIDKAAKLWIHDIWGDDLDAAAKEAGVDVKKHFKLSEEYLDLYSKDQLVKLAKEFNVNLEPGSKTDLIAQLLVNQLKDKIPAEMLKA